MVRPSRGPGLLVLLTAGERVAELVLSRRHRRWALSRGGREFGRAHYPVMVAAHAALLAGCARRAWRGTTRSGWPVGSLVGATILAQSLRWWCIASLGRQWNTRVVVVPGATLVRRGPYRWWRHPNYAAVAIEGVTLPLSVGGVALAVLFSVVNGVLLVVRIRCENRALAVLVGAGPR